MTQITLGHVRYDPQTRAFAAPVTVQDGFQEKSYPCRVRADAGRNPRKSPGR